MSPAPAGLFFTGLHRRASSSPFLVVRFQMTPNGIAAEDKIAVIKRLGRSPDKADAVVMAWYRGVTGGYQRQMYGQSGNGGKPLPKVHRGYEARKRYLRGR